MNPRLGLICNRDDSYNFPLTPNCLERLLIGHVMVLH